MSRRYRKDLERRPGFNGYIAESPMASHAASDARSGLSNLATATGPTLRHDIAAPGAERARHRARPHWRGGFTIDYGRPLVRGRVVPLNIVPFDYVWRTGANAATQFMTSAAITLAGLRLPAGAWGTDYDGSKDLGMASMQSETVATPVENFTIAITSSSDLRGMLTMEWGPFRWTAPIRLARSN